MRCDVYFRQPSPARRLCGFSKFEFALVAALFAVFVGMATNRLHAYQENAELVAVKQLIVSLQAALTLKTAQLTVSQRRADIAALADENPIGWLHDGPSNYLGEYYSPDNEHFPSGNWYFDRSNKTLVYMPWVRKSFSPRSLILLKFKVKSFHPPTIYTATPASNAINNLVLIQVFDEPVVTGK